MKKEILIIKLICSMLLILLVSAYGQEKDTLKILCYNLRFGELASLTELAEFIEKENPDIVALQEVDVLTKRERAPLQNGKHFISELGFRTNMFSLYGKTIPYAGGYYGIGILSKYPYLSVERILLPMPEGAKEQRAYLVSEIELPNNKTITFVSTHLDYTTSAVRQAQVKVINDDLLKRNGPIILCGDFNAKPDSKEIAEGMKDWIQTTSMDYTIPAKAPTSKIDYIFCYPSHEWKVISNETPKVQFSDHLPVVSTLELISK